MRLFMLITAMIVSRLQLFSGFCKILKFWIDFGIRLTISMWLSSRFRFRRVVNLEMKFSNTSESSLVFDSFKLVKFLNWALENDSEFNVKEQRCWCRTLWKNFFCSYPAFIRSSFKLFNFFSSWFQTEGCKRTLKNLQGKLYIPITIKNMAH